MKRISLALVMMCGSVFAQISVEWQLDLADELDIDFQNYEYFIQSSELLITVSGGVYTQAKYKDFSTYYDNNPTNQWHSPSVFTGQYAGPNEIEIINGLYIDADGFLSKTSTTNLSSSPPPSVFTGNLFTISLSDRHTTFRNGSFITTDFTSSSNKIVYIDEYGEYAEEAVTGECSQGNHNHFNHFYTKLEQGFTNSVPDDRGITQFYTTNVIITKYSITSGSNVENIVSGHVSSGFFQDNYVLSWESGLGIQYQIQSSTNLIDWTSVGQVLTGTGYPMTWANHITNSQAFYRVIED